MNFGTVRRDLGSKGSPVSDIKDSQENADWISVNTVNLTAEDMAGLNRSLDSVQYPPEVGGVSTNFHPRLTL